MRYYVTRIGPNGGPIASEHATLSEAVDEVMYLDSRGIRGINLTSIPDCPPPNIPDEED